MTKARPCGIGARRAIVVTLLVITAGAGCAARSKAARATPPSSTLAQTLELTDHQLSAALAQLAIAPTAAAHRRVAQEYLRLGVTDMAQEHYMNAVRLDPDDATAHDALARLWRDWGFPGKGLADAYRAVYLAPESPEAANTLGTLLQALGESAYARQWYLRALALDPAAWYAANNLCYLEVMGRQRTARATCEAAVAAASGTDTAIARNNLALAYAAAGDWPAARQWFRRAADPARADYNYGIALMAGRDYAEAADAFRTALLADPGFSLAAQRARQAEVAQTREH